MISDRPVPIASVRHVSERAAAAAYIEGMPKFASRSLDSRSALPPFVRSRVFAKPSFCRRRRLRRFLLERRRRRGACTNGGGGGHYRMTKGWEDWQDEEEEEEVGRSEKRATEFFLE